jgi:hypothetical protein
MGHVPDHTPTAATVEHAALIAALDAGDLAGIEQERAATLVGTCTGCACLLADLSVLRAATAALPVVPRTRDYRLTDADVARLRPSAWGRLVGWLGAPRSTVRPFAGGLAALGIAGLLLSTTPGFFGQSATTLSTTGAPVTAPGEAGGAGGGLQGNAQLSTAPTTPAGAAASPGPASSPMAATLQDRSPATLPTPSAAADVYAAPTATSNKGVLTGPGAAATPGPSGVSADAGAMDSASQAAPSEAWRAERNAALTPASEPVTPDRTLSLTVSLALLAAGLGLFVANRVLRHRAQA